MTPEVQNACLELLAGMLSPSQTWSTAVASLYLFAMQGWDDEIADRTVKHAALTEKWRPSPAELRLLAARLAAEELAPIPDPLATRREITRLIDRHGCRHAVKAPHSHPLIQAVVEEMGGWQVVGMSQTERIDQAFPAAYQKALSGLYEEIAQTQLHRPAEERRFTLSACSRRLIPKATLILDRDRDAGKDAGLSSRRASGLIAPLSGLGSTNTTTLDDWEVNSHASSRNGGSTRRAA